MKAKACARCRQYKLRCDSDVSAPAPCSRCRAANAVCVVDTNYQRVSKTRRLMELELEVARLRQQNKSHNQSQRHSQDQDQGQNQNQTQDEDQDQDRPQAQADAQAQDQSQDQHEDQRNIIASNHDSASFDFASPSAPNPTTSAHASASLSVYPNPVAHPPSPPTGDPDSELSTTLHHSYQSHQLQQHESINSSNNPSNNLSQQSQPLVPAPSADTIQSQYSFLTQEGELRVGPASFHLGDFQLSAAQVTQCFHTFFIQCHPWLKLSLPISPETLYAKCPLLFWVICAVSTSTATMLKLQSGIESLIGKVVVNPPRSVEVVQALLILCLWPFPFYSTLGDPSFMYCSIATQIGLQIGLHRPGLSQEFSKRKEVLEIDDHVRNSTWMACFIVNQTQTTRLGLRCPIQADFTFLHHILETPDFSNTSLLALCHISRLTAQFTSIIGADAQNSSGLIEPHARVGMVKFFKTELETLQKTRFPQMNQAIEISFLTSRLQLLSFILHEDVPLSSDVIELLFQAERDATALILIASEKNLSRCPFHVARSVLYAALTLIKIVASSYSQQPQVIFDQITLASRTLSTAIKVPNDHAERWSRHLPHLIAIRDLKRTPLVRSRMSAWLVYDAIRVMKEHLDATLSTSPAAGIDIPGWMNPETAAGLIDLDGLNWDSLGDML